jgi:DNA polymerase-1
MAKEMGYVETLFHRRRYVPELASQNRNTYNFGMRAAMNAPVQGTAADLIKMAMVNVKKRIEEESLDAALILQVHDELILEVAEQDAEKARLVLEEEMENAITLDVPILASSKIGKTWGDLK